MAKNKTDGKGKAVSKSAGKANGKAKGKAKGKTKAMTKSAVVQNLAETTKLSKKQVNEVFDALVTLIKQQLGGSGPGMFTIPGLFKLKRVHKPATPERRGTHPFTKEPTTFKAKPARNLVR